AVVLQARAVGVGHGVRCGRRLGRDERCSVAWFGRRIELLCRERIGARRRRRTGWGERYFTAWWDESARRRRARTGTRVGSRRRFGSDVLSGGKAPGSEQRALHGFVRVHRRALRLEERLELRDGAEGPERV